MKAVRDINTIEKMNFLWNAVGLALNSFNSLFFLMAVKLINGVECAGVFTYAFSLGCLFYIIALYYNRAFQIADENSEMSFNDFCSSRILTTIISIVLIVIFAIINRFNAFKIEVIALIMLYKGTEAIADCFYGEIQRKGKLYQAGFSLASKSLLGLVVFIIIDLITRSILLSICGAMSVNLIIFVLYDCHKYSLVKSSKFHFTLQKTKTLLTSSCPIFLFSVLSIYLANCQKYVLTYYVSNEMQTIFGILIMPATMVALVGSCLINPFLVNLKNLFDSEEYIKFFNLTKKVIGLVLVAGAIMDIVCCFIGIPILNLLFQMNLDKYRLHLIIIITTAVTYALTAIISSYLTILKENNKQLLIYMIVSVAATVASIVGVKEGALYGAIIAYMISGVMLLALYVVLYARVINKICLKGGGNC